MEVLAIKCAVLLGSVTSAFIGSIFLLICSRPKVDEDEIRDLEAEAADRELLEQSIADSAQPAD